MKSYKDYQQMMAHLMRQGYNKGGYVRLKNGGVPRLPVTKEQQKQAQELYGKDFKDLTTNQRFKLRAGQIKTDNVTFEQYLDDYKKMTSDPNYVPKFIKPEKGKGSSPQKKRAREQAKKIIENFDEKLLKNINKRKKLKRAADPEKREKDLVAQAERKARRRAGKKDVAPTDRENKINLAQRAEARKFNLPIKNNPDLVLTDPKLMDELSTTVSKTGDIIKIPTGLTKDFLKERGLFEVEHQRDIFKEGRGKNLPYNRNLIAGPHNRTGGFKNMAEKFIEKNPDPNNPKVQDIIKKAKDLKITIRPDVPDGTFPTKALGYKQLPDPIEKFKDVGNKYTFSSGPTLGANIGLLKGVGETIKAIPTPTGAVALNLAFQPDLSSGIDRAALGAEAAFAPELVRQTSRVSSAPIVQRFFNLGLSPQLAARAARVVSPLGLATLAGEGVYQLGRLGAEQRRRMQEMTPEQRRLFDAEQQSISEFAAAGGGIAKLAGKESGPPPEKGPDSEGLASLLKNVKKR